MHRGDAAHLLRLAVEQAPAGARLHAVAEEAITTKVIAEALGAALGLPVVAIDPADAGAHFGLVGSFFATPMTATSSITRDLLGWKPTGPGLVDDIAAGAYSTS